MGGMCGRQANWPPLGGASGGDDPKMPTTQKLKLSRSLKNFLSITDTQPQSILTFPYTARSGRRGANLGASCAYLEELAGKLCACIDL